MKHLADTATLEESKLQVLQLQCIIDAKNRELQLLRETLSGQEDVELVNNLQSDVIRLREEVQRLVQENKYLRAQPLKPAVEDQRNAAEDQSPSSRVISQSSNAGLHNAVKQTGSSFQPSGQPVSADNLPGGRPAAAVDPGALVEKLRSLVTGLVAEAMAVQQQQQQQLPLLPQRGSSSSVSSQGTIAREPQPSHLQQASASQGAPALPSSSLLQQPLQPTQLQSQPGQGMFVWAPSASNGAPLQDASSISADVRAGSGPSATANVPSPCVQVIVHPFPSPAFSLPTGWPGAPCVAVAMDVPRGFAAPVHGVEATSQPQQLPSQQSDRTSGAAVNSSPSARVHCGGAALATQPAPAGMAGGSSDSGLRQSAPAVLELNVDGTVVFVDRAVLETQALGSKLYNIVLLWYHSLPLDSQGRPYLSYDPGVFKALLSFLKERWLFGAAAPARDWPQLARSLGVSPLYFQQVASHFGLSDVVASLQSPTETALPTTTLTSAATSGSSPLLAHGPTTPPLEPLGPKDAAATAGNQTGTGPRGEDNLGACGDRPMAAAVEPELRMEQGPGGTVELQLQQGEGKCSWRPQAGRLDEQQQQTEGTIPDGNVALGVEHGAKDAAKAADRASTGRQAIGETHTAGLPRRASGQQLSATPATSPRQPRPGIALGEGGGRDDGGAPVSSSPRTSRIPSPPSQSAVGLGRLRSSEPDAVSPSANGDPAGLQPSVGDTPAAPANVGAGTESERHAAVKAAAAGPYRMPSLYTLLAARQLAEE